jgi:yecA family protein
MSWPETAGFLLAVQACPDLVMPSEWIEIVQGDARFADHDELQAVSEARMALINWIADCIRDDRPALPNDCRPDPEPLRILESDNNFSRWCLGITTGHDWLEQSWHDVLEIDSDDDQVQGTALLAFAFFTNRTMAERVVEAIAADSSSGPTLEELANNFHSLIDQAVLEYAAIGLAYRQMPPAPPPQEPVRSEKIGRNQPCPCGSGKKYKKCCGRPGAGRLH